MDKKHLALTGYFPWYWAILFAGKDIENRKWRTQVRVTIAIHTSKTTPAKEDLIARSFIKRVAGVDVPDPVNGAIIGVVDIVDCISEAPLLFQPGTDSPWLFGKYGYVLCNPKPLPEPIVCAGAMKFWALPVEIVQEIDRQLTNSCFNQEIVPAR